MTRHWFDENERDPGVVVLQLLAWLAAAVVWRLLARRRRQPWARMSPR